MLNVEKVQTLYLLYPLCTPLLRGRHKLYNLKGRNVNRQSTIFTPRKSYSREHAYQKSNARFLHPLNLHFKKLM